MNWPLTEGFGVQPAPWTMIPKFPTANEYSDLCAKSSQPPGLSGISWGRETIATMSMLMKMTILVPLSLN